jgi:filamentous hemagglutinin family protein
VVDVGRDEAYYERGSPLKQPYLHLIPYLAFSISLVLGLSDKTVSAQSASPITSSGLNTRVSPPSTVPSGKVQYDITGGTRPAGGVNLFHSFGDFNVPNNNIANLLNETALPTTNILSRVTGGNPSNIFGTIQTTSFGGANLYLINPAGVVFGPTASLNVGGSFNASTADYLKMTDGAKFYANPSQPTVLSIAPVAAFGFLSGNPAPIALQGGIVDSVGNKTTLNVSRGQTLSLVGGDITMAGPLNLVAASGQISVASVASAGEITSNLRVGNFAELGTIKIVNSELDVSGNSRLIVGAGTSGTVVMRGGHLVMDRANIVAKNASDLAGAPLTVDIQVSRRVEIGGEFEGIEAGTIGKGRAGDVSIKAATVEIAKGTFIGTESSGDGRAGNIFIEATDNFLYGRESQSLFNTMITTSNQGSGEAGTILINTPDLVISNFAQINSNTVGTGPGGSIELNVGKQLTITSGGSINSATNDQRLGAGGPVTSPTPAGAGGTISITSPLVVIDQGGLNTATEGSGRAGNIRLNIGELRADTSIIRSSSLTSDAGSAGQIAIRGLTGSGSAATSVNLNNSIISTTIAGGSRTTEPASIEITAQSVNLANGAQIAADTSGGAPAGNITLNLGTLMAGAGSAITSSSSTSSASTAGDAGRITVQGPAGRGSAATYATLDDSAISTTIAGGNTANTPATISISSNDVNLTNAALIQADTQGAASAGNIHITARTLDVNNLAAITSLTAGEGNAGTINIKAQESLTITGAIAISPDQVFRSTIASSALPGTSGDAGKVTIEAPAVTIADGATVTTTTFSSGPGGDATLLVDTLTVSNGGSISSGTFGSSGHGGSISIRANEAVSIDGQDQQGNKSNIAVASLSGSGDAGTLTLNSKALTLDGGSISALTTGDGKAGAIDLAVQSMVARNGSQISTSTTFGKGEGGSLTIRGRQSPMADSLIVSDSLIDSSTLGNGNAGQVTIAAKQIMFDSDASVSASTGDPTGLFGITGQGRAGNVVITGETIQLLNGSIVDSSTFGGGSGGSIHVTANDQLLLSGRSQEGVSTLATVTAGSGNAGEILVETPKLIVQEGTIFANTGTSGAAGTIKVKAGELSLLDALIASRGVKEATGDAGAVNIQVSGLVSSQGSTVSSQAVNGKGGDVTITAGNLQVTKGSTISAETLGAKDAGGITLTSESDILMRSSTVSTSADQASGGNIKLTAPNLVRIVDSTITSSVQGQAGTSNGGNITIDPQVVVIQNSTLKAEANAGAGGDINITALGAVLVDPNSVLSATAATGISGSVNISSPVQVLSGALVPMKLAYTQAGLSSDRCAADPKGQFSSFVQTGRDGAPQSPGGFASSPLGFLDTFRTSSLDSDPAISQTARLGLSNISGDTSNAIRFFSACRS